MDNSAVRGKLRTAADNPAARGKARTAADNPARGKARTAADNPAVRGKLRDVSDGAARIKPRGASGGAAQAVRKLVAQEGEPPELLAYLLAVHPNQGRNAVKAMLARGQVSVGGVAVTAYNYPLRPGDTVEIRKGKPPEAMRFAGLAILHEDADLIVIRKEAGLLSVATEEEKELTAYRQLSDYVKRADPRQRVFVLHRLDRDTSGVMMFARSEQVQKQMQESWKEVMIERVYTALVEGHVRQQEGKVESWLKENAAMKMYASAVPGDGQHAVTHYRQLRVGNGYSLLELRLETGRKNQIRVHMQDIGHPIAGDKKYGAKTKPIGRLGLHASLLAFKHPTTGEQMRFKSDVPKVFISVFGER